MKYMGSKSRIAKYIVPILQECIDSNHVTTYIEPFVGGGNVIDKIRCQERIGSDINPYLIALLKRVQEGKPLLNEVSKDTYNLVKDAWKDGTDKDKYEQWYVGNIGFLASYNGKWFDGGYGKPHIVKTPNGNKIRDYYQEGKRNLEKQAENLTDILFDCKSYQYYNPKNYRNCVFYLDPPYSNTTTYGIANNFDSSQFWDFARELSKQNYVFVSELTAPYDFEMVWSKPVLRSIEAKAHTYKNECLFKWKGNNK